LTEESIHKWLREKLSSYMVPGQVVIVPALPLTANGKIDRSALRAIPSQTAPSSAVLPANPIERVVCEIWREVLGRPVAITDRFFDLGGNSLSAFSILGRVEVKFSVRLPIKDFFDRPTVAAMAEWLSDIIDVESLK
jgi:acyl carrier protein